MSDIKNKTEITSSLKTNGNSKSGKSFNSKLNSFLSKPVGKLTSLVLALVLLAGIAFGAYTQIVNNNDNAQAGLNCPSGSQLNSAGTGCVSTTPSGYTCPSGQTLSGTNCITFSCPNGGVINGASCVGDLSSPVITNTSCPYAGTSLTVKNGGSWNAIYGPTPTCLALTTAAEINSWPIVGQCTIQVPGFPPVPGPVNIYLINGYFLCGYTDIPDPQSGADTFVEYWNFRVFNSIASYTASQNLVGPATPQFNTPVTSGVTYTPNQGEISNFSCTPTPATSGGSVVCSGQATGAPSGVPYSGDITVTIDNGGGTATVALTASGSFSTTVDVGTITGNTPVVKNATTNIGGTTPININPAATVIDPDLASGNGSIGVSTNCIASNNVTIGSTYSCDFPINGTGPFELPLGGIQTRTNKDTNNSNATSNCTITGASLNVLTCTNISTTASPTALTAGSANVQLGKGLTPTTFNNKGTVSLTNASSPLTTADIPGLTITCGIGGAPVTVNTTTTCTFTLTSDKTLPTDFKLGIGNSTPGGNCTLGANNLVTCTNIPTGTQTGNQPINGQIGNGAVTPTGETVNVVANQDILLITRDNITLTPNPITQGLSIFGNTDYTITVKDDRIVANGSTAVCTYKVKELSSPADNANRGWDRLTSTIISAHNNQGTYNTNTKLFEVNYNTTGNTNLGTSIKITKENQKFTDYDMEIRCRRNSDGQIFGRDERINFLFGAYSVVTVTGVVV